MLSAVDQFGNVDPSYVGTVPVSFTFSGAGTAHASPTSYKFLATDKAKHTYTLT